MNVSVATTATDNQYYHLEKGILPLQLSLCFFVDLKVLLSIKRDATGKKETLKKTLKSLVVLKNYQHPDSWGTEKKNSLILRAVLKVVYSVHYSPQHILLNLLLLIL